MRQKTIKLCLSGLFAVLFLGCAAALVIGEACAVRGKSGQSAALAATMPEAVRPQAVGTCECGQPLYRITSDAEFAYLVTSVAATGGGGTDTGILLRPSL